jgi:prolyl-tRNA synthetase
MKDDQKNEAITKRGDDFSLWYQDVIREADLVDNSPVRGCMVIKPYGYAIWENIQKYLDSEFKKTGAENAYFPLLIPKSFLEREAQHVEGFAKECAVVTHHRLEEKDGKLVPAGELEEPLVIRPTSETIIYDAYSKWIRSYRDLPLVINQWANVVRWEMRTRPFLRTTEFLWQEGHTAHATKLEAEEKAIEMANVYERFLVEQLAISPVPGKKTDCEKFAGADYTISLEAMMQDTKALQSCTSHMLGQNFAKPFNVSFVDENQEQQYVWQTSWGLSTRIIGAMIMSHSDDKGLVVPPNIAPIQVVIIPIIGNIEDEVAVMAKVGTLANELKHNGIKYKIDAREGRPGFKFFEWERKGVPIRIEIGPKDVAKNSFVAVDRIEGKKEFVDDVGAIKYLTNKLGEIQNTLFERNKKFREDNTRETEDYEDLKNIISEKGGFVVTHLCENKECEEKIKDDTSATSRCIPFNEEKTEGKCIYCKSKADRKVIIAKAY